MVAAGSARRCHSRGKDKAAGESPTPSKALTSPLRVELKAEVDLLEMGITGEDVHDPEVLHDHHAGEIDEGDVGLIVVLLPQLPGVDELG